MRRLILYTFLFLAIDSCRDKYNSPVHPSPAGYLVVEGFISNDSSATRIHLSRSVQLDSAHSVPETGATIIIEAKTGGVAGTLSEAAAGFYSGHLGPINNTDQYRIHISTRNRNDYYSDYSSTRLAPPIDSVSWKADSSGVNIYVSAHDASAGTVNYRWNFDETWKYTSAYYSELIYSYPSFYTRDSSQQIYTCYQSAVSANVLVASSKGLAKDEINQFPIAKISFSTTNRLSNNYSINVRQYAMSAEALNYYQILAKNTEQLGSIFDAQPSALAGNIHSAADANELVLGFIECSGKTEQRIFINRNQLPDVGIATGHGGCGILTRGFSDNASLGATDTAIFHKTYYLPISGIADDATVTNLTYSNELCVDCRAQGGTTTKPSFWP